MSTHTRTLVAVTLAGALTLSATGCTAAPGSETSPALIPHVHDVAFDLDGALLVGAHTGVYRVDLTTDEVPLVGKTTFDAMGLTVQGDTILASGHPDPANQDHTFTAPNVGLVRYSEAGWEQVSLAGVTDFHMLAATPAAPEILLGLPSDRAVLAESTDAGQTWADLVPLTARDISIDTTQADIVTATTPDGLMVSRDGGTTFSPVPNAPALLVITADPTVEEGIIGVDTDGTIWTGATTPDAVWRTAGHATGTASAIAVSWEGIVAIADEGGVRTTSDAGNTWRVVIRTEPTS
jgi:hypothetical protein